MEEFDAIVCGAGPSGSTVASFLARAGRRVALLEQETFPRHQIGESLLPQSWAILRAIGADEAVLAEGYVRKYAALFHSERSGRTCRFPFRNALDPSHPFIYQVERSRFDTVLRDHAVRCGVSVRQPERVTDVAKDAAGVTVNGRYRAQVLIRAGGIGTAQVHPDNYVPNDDADNVTGFYSYFARPATDHAREESGDIHINLFYDEGEPRPHWSWVIPISRETWSVGFVMPTSAFARLRRDGQSFPAIAEGLLERVPYVRSLLGGHEALAPWRMRFNFQRIAKAQYLPREFLVGDAAGFIDPVFSSGVHLGLHSASMVAQGLAGADWSDEAALARVGAAYGAEYRAMFWVYYRFVKLFYQRNVVENLFLASEDLDDPAKSVFVREFTSILAGDFRSANRIVQTLDRANLTVNPHVRTVFTGAAAAAPA